MIAAGVLPTMKGAIDHRAAIRRGSMLFLRVVAFNSVPDGMRDATGGGYQAESRRLAGEPTVALAVAMAIEMAWWATCDGTSPPLPTPIRYSQPWSGSRRGRGDHKEAHCVMVLKVADALWDGAGGSGLGGRD